MSVKIITAIPDIRFNGSRPNYLREISYSLCDGTFETGRISCEAPVKTLIRNAYDKDKGSKIEILCLVSAETLEDGEIREREIKVDSSSHTSTTTEISMRKTSLQYFKDRIDLFVKDNSYTEISYVPICYDINNPAANIHDILIKIQKEDIIYIDITSGPRTLPSHVTMCMEAMLYRGIKIESIVYAQLGANIITHEEYIYDIINLINAVSDFTNHGKSDALSECFKDTQDNDLKELCGAMKEFSNQLAICRISDIDKKVDEINGYLDQLSSKKISENDKDLPNTEKVFNTLIPAIKDKFVQNADNECWKKLNLIQWCLDRGMIQQALSLFRENAALILIDHKLIKINIKVIEPYFKKFKRGEHDTLSNFAVERLYRFDPNYNPADSTYAVDEYNKWEVRVTTGSKDRTIVTCSTLHNKTFEKAKNYGYEIEMEKNHFHDFICYFYNLNFLRNTVMHAGVYDGKIEIQKNEEVPEEDELIEVESKTAGKKRYLYKIGLYDGTKLPNYDETEIINFENIHNTLQNALNILRYEMEKVDLQNARKKRLWDAINSELKKINIVLTVPLEYRGNNTPMHVNLKNCLPEESKIYSDPDYNEDYFNSITVKALVRNIDSTLNENIAFKCINSYPDKNEILLEPCLLPTSEQSDISKEKDDFSSEEKKR